jgi:hypothetical protein
MSAISVFNFSVEKTSVPSAPVESNEDGVRVAQDGCVPHAPQRQISFWVPLVADPDGVRLRRNPGVPYVDVANFQW